MLEPNLSDISMADETTTDLPGATPHEQASNSVTDRLSRSTPSSVGHNSSKSSKKLTCHGLSLLQGTNHPLTNIVSILKYNFVV